MELLTVKEAAGRAGTTPKAIHACISAGEVTRHMHSGRVLVDADEVAGYVSRKGWMKAAQQLRSYGILSGIPGSSQSFMARKSAEKEFDR